MGRMKPRKKILEAEIEQQLIADADDPEAWEAPITVPPSHRPRPESYERKYYQPTVKPEVAHKSFAKRRHKASKRSKFDTR